MKASSIKASRKGFRTSRHQEQEFGPGKTGIILCPVCNAAYFLKSWHHDLSKFSYIREDKKIEFKKCPACQMWFEKEWEGEIRIGDMPSGKIEEVKRAALGTANQAYRKDPMHRVFDIRSSGKDLIIYTSENQLAMRVARKLERSFKKHFSKSEIHHGKSEDAFLIKMRWIK